MGSKRGQLKEKGWPTRNRTCCYLCVLAVCLFLLFRRPAHPYHAAAEAELAAEDFVGAALSQCSSHRQLGPLAWISWLPLGSRTSAAGAPPAVPGQGGYHPGQQHEQLSFGDVLRARWRQEKHTVLFGVEQLPARHHVGITSKWAAEMLCNPQRRKPPGNLAYMVPHQPFDPEVGFNFYKAEVGEFLMAFVPSFERAGHDIIGSQDVLGCLPVGTQAPSPDRIQQVEGMTHAVLLNVKPLGAYSMLLLPFFKEQQAQEVTARSLRVAIDFSLALVAGGEGSMRVGFNGLGATASVNHLHFQIWEFSSSPDGLLPIERVVPVKTLDNHHLYTAKDVSFLPESYPVRGMVFALPLPAASGAGGAAGAATGTEATPCEQEGCQDGVLAAARLISTCVKAWIDLGVPYTMLFSQGKAYLLPRQAYTPLPFAAMPGFPELSGELIITDTADFATLTADDLWDALRTQVSVEALEFSHLVRACLPGG